MIKLGCTYRDRVTGFVGVAYAWAKVLAGGHLVRLESQCGLENKPSDAMWVEVERVEQLGDEQIVLDNSATPGPDTPASVQ